MHTYSSFAMIDFMSFITPELMQASTNTVTKEEVEGAVTQGITRYFDACRARIPMFIDNHFNYPGAIKTNRVALGWDMLRAPVNLFWAPIYALICLVKYLVRKTAGYTWFYHLLDKVPAGFTTKVQQYISTKIMSDLLCSSNTLEDSILDSIQAIINRHDYSKQQAQEFRSQIGPLVKSALVQYQITRTASADITNSLSCILWGAFVFQKFTPGGFGVALVLAPLLAKTLAAKEFILGETLGNMYYNWFPPEPTFSMTFGTMVLVMALLSIAAAFSGVITDPVQAAIGLHRRRLRKMLNHLQQDLLTKTSTSFQLKDQFIARVLDVFDITAVPLTFTLASSAVHRSDSL